MSKKTYVLSLAAISGLLLSGCSGSEQPTDSTATSDELATISVGVLESVADLPIYLGESEGIFEKHGIELEFDNFNAGSAMVPAVLEGSTQIGNGNLLAAEIGAQEGLPLQVMAPSMIESGDADTDMSAIVVAKDSGITSVEELEDKKIAINAFSSISEVAVAEVLEEAGLSSASVDILELPFPQIPEALDSGTVDAGFLIVPFPQLNSDILDIIASPFSEHFEGEIIGGYFASSDWLSENEDLAQSFVDALEEASIYTNEHEAEAREKLQEVTELPEDVVNEVPIPKFGGDLVETPKIVNKAKDLEILKEDIDYEAVYWKWK